MQAVKSVLPAAADEGKEDVDGRFSWEQALFPQRSRGTKKKKNQMLNLEEIISSSSLTVFIRDGHKILLEQVKTFLFDYDT